MSLKKLQVQRSHGAPHDALRIWVRFPGKGRNSFEAAPKNKRATSGDPSLKPPPDVTHFLLRGGRWSIPTEYNDEFLWHYAISINQGHHASVVERRTQIFRFHIDLDFNQGAEVTLDEVRRYLIVVQGVLRRFFPLSENEFFELTVSAAPCKPVNGDGVKTGYHVIWHNIWVDAVRALDLRASIIADLKARFGDRQPPMNMWEDVVDESIYISNGLRMIGAVKWAMCRCSRGKRKRAKPTAPFPKTSVPDAAKPPSAPSEEGPCEKCHGQGFVYEGRPYWVVALWDADCDPSERCVSVPGDNAPPVYKAPVGFYRRADDPSPLYTAMPMPQWTPAVDDDEDDGPMDESETVPLRDLIVLGDPNEHRHQLKDEEDIWDNVRRFHNTMRLTSLRCPPALEQTILEEEQRLAALGVYPDEQNTELGKLIPLFKRPAFAPPTNTPDQVKARMKYDTTAKRRYDSFGKRIELVEEYKKWNQQGVMSAVLDEALIVDVERFIQHNAGKRHTAPYLPYEYVRVRNIIFKPGKGDTKRPKCFYVHVEGTGSAYCQNKGADHHGHSIYFEITAKALFQKCFCRCSNKPRLNGPCKEYRKEECGLPGELRLRLFGSKNDTHQLHSVENAVDELAKPFVVPTLTFDDPAMQARYEARLAAKRQRERELGLPDVDERNLALASAQ